MMSIVGYDVFHEQGDLKAKIEDGKLYIAASAISMLAPLRIEQYAEYLVSYLHSFPTGVMVCLNWDTALTESAKQRLINVLSGYIDNHWLRPPVHEKRTHGARPPIDITL